MSGYAYGRLVARLKRLIAKRDRDPAYYDRRILQTTAELIVEERRLADPLAPAREPSWDEVRARLRLMQPGAGLEVPR